MASITCEICGKPVYKKQFYKYEGIVLIMCEVCAAKLGATRVTRQEVVSIKHVETKKKRVGMPRSSAAKVPEELTVELVPGYGKKIREAREARGLDRDKLAKELGIPISTLRNIERERLKPDIVLAKRIERILGIKILKKIDLELLDKISVVHREDQNKLTLGDILIIEKPKKHKKDE